ncbi:dihydrolipoyllysine-residue acetyltransferase component of pyruvate dehydrogenase complex, mitochondrial isoform X2 [Agrilus planipennis]|uniref:Dihydrolipoamide acetyltransferase component of pyruvate dehydrogenase complex n=1 Tax=Agrilus planipennis TaxID=224129 RepID=A0A1W4XNZ5_AGRPL|nr:dihydrolipoyllysine-residue acetyltransferase component of pyruvate dehydrogenase complex, mitochondrial isoform X2 [Agrilus planipennis]
MFCRTIARNSLIKQTIRKSVSRTALRSISAGCCSNKELLNRKEVTAFNQAKPAKWNFQTVRNYSSYPPHIKVPLPALSPTMETGTIISWEKKEGDKLNEGDLLAEIETDKATMGFETPEEGYLAKILVPAGVKNIPIGKLVCIIVEKEEDVAKFKDFKDDSSPSPAAAAPAPSAPAPKPAAAAPQAPAAASAAASDTPPQGGRVLVSPMAKGLAEKKNIRLQGKGAPAPPPSSPGAPPKAPTPAPGAAHVDIPVTNMRAVIAKRLTESKVQIPHYYVTMAINVDKLLKFRERVNKKYEKKGVKVSVNDFIIKATAAASKRVPEANSSWLGDVIRQYKNVDVAVAVATPKGLLTPIVKEVNDKGVIQISSEMKELAAKARDGKLQPHEFQGGTITVSNLGMMGVTHFTAVINPPHSIIIAIGATNDTLVPDKSEKGFKVAKIMHATASCDHRTVDGAVAAEWMQAFTECLEEPENMIL